MLPRFAVGLALPPNSGQQADPYSTARRGGSPLAGNPNLERRSAPRGAARTPAAPARSGIGKQFFGAK